MTKCKPGVQSLDDGLLAAVEAGTRSGTGNNQQLLGFLRVGENSAIVVCSYTWQRRKFVTARYWWLHKKRRKWYPHAKKWPGPRAIIMPAASLEGLSVVLGLAAEALKA